MSEKSRGLSKVEEICSQRSGRAKELKDEGKKIMGYFCIYPPLEMLSALDLLPYRILGDMREPITKADACLPTVVCPFDRSALDLGLKGKYDFLDGVVWAHVCEVGEKTAHVWRTYLNPAYFHFVDIPHTIHKPAQNQFVQQLKDFQKTLMSFTGKKLTSEMLVEAINAHNEQRSLVRKLYDLRKPDPPLISGSEVIKTLKAIMSLPVKEGSELLREVISEVGERKDGVPFRPVRLLIWGSIIDDTPLIEMMEELGANVVMDDTCVGSRAFFPDVKLTPDPLEGLAYRYLVDLKCPRTFKESTYGETKKDYLTDLRSRFSYISDYAKEWKVSGVVLQSVRYCDIHGYEVPGLGDYLDSVGLPHTYIEHTYDERSLAPLRTRIQAFLEIIRS